MKQKHKKIGIIIIIVLAVFVISIFVANQILERKITTALDNLPETVKIEYSEIDINLWTGNLEISKPIVTITGETTSKTILNATLKTIEINDIGYWDYLFNDKISVETFSINHLVAKYKHNPVVKNDDYKSGFLDKVKQLINVENIKINNADILVTNYDTDSTLLSVPKLNFELHDFQLNPKASKTDQKVNYKNFKLTAQNLKWATNEFENIFADSILVTNDNAKFTNFKFKTKYDRAEYSTILKTERDHFDIIINEFSLSDLDFGFNAEDKFYFKSKKVLLYSPKTEIYRDKLVADDLTYKPLYGTQLRNLNFELGIDSLEIIEGELYYLEKVKRGNSAGRLDFTAMNATVANLGNIYGTEATTINVQTTFMEKSPLKVDWNFKVSDSTDQFLFKADLGFIAAARMDQFTQPNLNVDFNGELMDTYFTISGNPKFSRIDLKMKYDDFEVLILRKDSSKKNKFLSTIANMFVSKNSKDNSDPYRYGQAESVERDVTKSVFNFVWINVRDGLRSAMTGNGKKED